MTPSNPSLIPEGVGNLQEILLEARFLTQAYVCFHLILTATPRENRASFLLHSKDRWVAQVHTAHKGWCIRTFCCQSPYSCHARPIQEIKTYFLSTSYVDTLVSLPLQSLWSNSH